MEITTPVYAFEDVDEVVVDVMGVEVGIVFVCADEEVFGKGAGAETEECIGQSEDFLRLALGVRDVAFGADGDEEGVNARGVDGVDGFEAGDFHGYHWAGDVVDEVADIGTLEGSSGFSVDEATEALRAMKKKSKSKKKKKS